MKEERGRGFFDEGVAWLARGDYREGGRSGGLTMTSDSF